MHIYRDGQPMKLLRQFEENRNLSNAKQKTYKNVTFVNGFAKFIESLKSQKIIINHGARVVVEGKHKWSNEVKDGGILFETTLHPLVSGNRAGDVVFIGNADTLSQIEKLFEQHEVEYDGATKPSDVKLKYQYHDELNPALWEDEDTLKPEVRKKMLEAAKAFYESLKLPDLEIEDITFTGSNANYNWTANSDVDIHILTDFGVGKEQYGEIVEELFEAKKSVFNNLHTIMIGQHEVEFYVQCSKETHISTGVYSIENESWIERPVHEPPQVDDSAVKAKTADWMNRIDAATGNCNKADVVEKLMDRLKKMRQTGLDDGGEFSVENLVFKQLRYNGYLEKLATCRTKAFDRELSIEEEEWNNMC